MWEPSSLVNPKTNFPSTPLSASDPIESLKTALLSNENIILSSLARLVVADFAFILVCIVKFSN